MNLNTNTKIAFIDLDGTLIKGQSQALFIKFLKKKKLIGSFQAFVISFWFLLYKMQILKNTEKILAYALSCFKNKPFAEISNCVDEFIEKVVRFSYYKDVSRFIEDMKSKKIKLILLSTSVDIIVEKIAKDLNFDEFISTKVEVAKGTFTGKIIGTQIYGLGKLIEIEKYISDNDISLENTLILADNYSDKKMLLKAGTGIVANPNLQMRSWALQNNLPVIYLDRYEPIQYIQPDTLSQ